MILSLFMFFITLVTFASPAVNWPSMMEISERHEFYKDNEVIIKPKGTWQILFGLVYMDKELKLNKDCVYYRVPDEAEGIFKIKAVKYSESCEKYIEQKGELEWSNLKALQYSIGETLNFHFTFSDFKTVKWTIPLLNRSRLKVPKSFSSSAEFRAPKVILLAPSRGSQNLTASISKLSDRSLCHSIGDDCQELGASVCSQCPEGWYEIPNGCTQGPKYCGNKICGQRNAPACRRGVKWQRVRKKFDCRTDTSFAYCSPGLTIQCEGPMAYCR